MTSPGPIPLPSIVQRRLDSAAEKFIRPDIGISTDFSMPPGEPALAAPDSVSWQVFKNPLALFVGGVAAVILELAEPRVRTGVWEHTSFRKDPLRRMQRTGMTAMVTVYGPRSRAEAMIARVRTMHARVHGTTPEGLPYRADDPELLAWVHATASFGFLEAYRVYANRLGDADCDRFYAEGATSSHLYGAASVPGSQQELHALFDAMRAKLTPSPVIFEFLDIVRRMRLLPRPLASVQRLLIQAAVNLVPPWVRERLGLEEEWDLRDWQHALIRQAGALIDRVPLRSAPAAQSCRRLGLPEDYLYMRRHNRAST